MIKLQVSMYHRFLNHLKCCDMRMVSVKIVKLCYWYLISKILGSKLLIPLT